MQIHFIGAARTVTGSMHLLSINSTKILLDCGMFQGKRAEAFERNRNFEFFDPEEIHAVVLSHAHIDHCGNLPTLVRQGFRGNVYATHATRDLCSLLLADSAHIQQRDAEFVNKKHTAKGEQAVQPLYSIQDVARAMEHFQSVSYRKEFQMADDITATYYDAGHILGSAITVLDVRENSRTVRLAFTGDLGRPNLPILRDPEPVGDVDVLITESTYGGRFHDPPDTRGVKLSSVMQRTVDRGGKVLVPAFSVGRTQDLIYELHTIWDEGRFPHVPVYVDSPLSVNATAIFRMHPECFDAETCELLQHHDDPFGFDGLKYISSVEESKQLNEKKDPFVVVASSGMCEAGRILHHLANNIENPKNTIMIIGYCAENTLGKKIVEKMPRVKILGEEYELKSEVAVLNSFSAHADRNELLSYLGQFDKKRMKNLFVVHGDYDQQQKLAGGLQGIGFQSITIPERGDVVEI